MVHGKLPPGKLSPYSNPNYNLNPNSEGNLSGAVLREEIFTSRVQIINNCFVIAAKIGSCDKAKILIQKKGYGKRKISNIEIQKIYKGTEKLFIFRPDLTK